MSDSRFVTDEEFLEWCKRIVEGATIVEVAEEFGRARGTVGDHLKGGVRSTEGLQDHPLVQRAIELAPKNHLERVYNNILTEPDVIKMLRMWDERDVTGITQKDLADKFGVHHTTIHRIVAEDEGRPAPKAWQDVVFKYRQENPL